MCVCACLFVCACVRAWTCICMFTFVLLLNISAACSICSLRCYGTGTFHRVTEDAMNVGAMSVSRPVHAVSAIPVVNSNRGV